MIGADELSGQAKGLEDAAKDQDTAYIGTHHEEALIKYRDTVQGIRRAFGREADSGQEVDGDKRTKQEISSADLVKKLEEIKESLSTFEAEKAERQIGELNGFVYGADSVADLLREVLQDVEDFEIVAASEKVEAFICRVKGGGE